MKDAVGGIEECLFDQNILIKFQAAQTLSEFLLKYPLSCSVVENDVPLILFAIMELSSHYNAQILIESLNKCFTALNDKWLIDNNGRAHLYLNG